jgi:hypothetical protein
VHVEARAHQQPAQPVSREVHPVARRVQMQPALARDLGLHGREVGHADQQQPAGAQPSTHRDERGWRVVQMLEHVPHHGGVQVRVGVLQQITALYRLSGLMRQRRAAA